VQRSQRYRGTRSRLGAGRRTKETQSTRVGVVCLKKRQRRREGEPLAEIHARDEASAAEAAPRFGAYELGDERHDRARSCSTGR